TSSRASSAMPRTSSGFIAVRAAAEEPAEHLLHADREPHRVLDVLARALGRDDDAAPEALVIDLPAQCPLRPRRRLRRERAGGDGRLCLVVAPPPATARRSRRVTPCVLADAVRVVAALAHHHHVVVALEQL